MREIIYGVNPVREVLKKRPDRFISILIYEGKERRDIHDIIAVAKKNGIKIEFVDKWRIDRLTGSNKHQGVAAELREFIYSDIADILDSARKKGDKPFIVILDGIEDPQNLGAIIRSAHCFGVHGVIIPKDRSASITGVVYKASAGAVEYIAVARVVNISRAIDELKEEGLWIVGASSEAKTSILDFNFPESVGIVIGGEGRGIRPVVMERCDYIVSIPMKGAISSLNASVASGILIYEAMRARIKNKT